MKKESKIKILSAISLTEQQVERIKAVDEHIEVHWYGRKDADRIPAEVWRDAEILLTSGSPLPPPDQTPALKWVQYYFCHLYTSDAADHLLFVDLGGRRIS